MRRTVLMAGLAALVAALPVPSPANAEVDAIRPPAPATPVSVKGDLVRREGMPCSLMPVRTAGDPAPLGSADCPGVRPGGLVQSTIGECTLNFLFGASDGTRYIGTAGHCVDPGQETTFKDSDTAGNGRIERVWAEGSGPVALDVTRRRIGEFVYAIVYPPKDFALIRLDPGVEASPEMCHFGAPRGVFSTTDAPEAAVLLRYYGNGTGVSDVTPARSAVALGTPDPDHVYAAGLALPGDSGAGVMTADGLAVGVLVSTGLSGLAFERDHNRVPTPSEFPEASERGVDAGTMGITRLGPQLTRASQKLGVPLQLITGG